jgi:hypothetical protein
MASCYYSWFDRKRNYFFSSNYFSFLSKDFNSDPSKISVYFIDIGQREYISMNNIRSLPEEFQRKPAFAIPCCLYNVCPLNGNERSIWKPNDQVHDEFNRLMVNNVTCQVCAKQDQLYYDVQIDIPSE